MTPNPIRKRRLPQTALPPFPRKIIRRSAEVFPFTGFISGEESVEGSVVGNGELRECCCVGYSLEKGD